MNLIELLEPNLRETLSQIDFKKGETIIAEGEVCQGVYLVAKGQVRIASYGLSGVEIVYNQIGVGGLFGNNLVFASDPRFRGHVMGDIDGTLIFINKERLIALLREDEEFLKEYLREQSDFGKSLNAKLKILSFPSPKDRLDFYLALNNGEVRFRSVTELAQALFLKRETLSRLLHHLERQGTIELTKGRIRLRP